MYFTETKSGAELTLFVVAVFGSKFGNCDVLVTVA